VEPRKKGRFSIVKLEMRIAPAPAAVLIPSVDLNDPGVNGAEHACKGLQHAVNNPNQQLQLFRHGCGCDVPPPPPPPCGCPCPPPCS
jgi:hypothetical protein